MQDLSKLVEYNPQLGRLNGLYRDTREAFAESKVANSLQIAIDQAYQAASDKSLFSAELDRLVQTDELRAALDPRKANFLLSFDFKKISQCLDISEDFGGITHYLASHCDALDAIRLDVDRARLTHQRCSEFDSVSVINEQLDNLRFPPSQYQLIVLGQLETLNLSSHIRATLLSRLLEALSDDGVLIINMPNSDKIANWLSGSRGGKVPYQELYGKKDLSYTHAALEADLAEAGFNNHKRYVSYSATDALSNLFSTDYLRDEPHAINHFYRLGAIENPAINEFLLFSQLAKEAHSNSEPLIENGSRFVYFAAKQPKPIQDRINISFAHYPGRSRKYQWRALTQLIEGSEQVTKQRLHSDNTGSELLEQKLEPQPFIRGSLLVSNWLQAALDVNTEDLSLLVSDYWSWLVGLFEEHGQNGFSEFAYDLTPFNVLLNESSETHYASIDPEWISLKPITPEFVMFRALFWFAFENRALLSGIANKLNLPTIADFVSQFHPTIRSSAEQTTFANLEELYQAEINRDFRAGGVSQALYQTLGGSSSSHSLPQELSAQIQWGSSATEMSQTSASELNWTPQHGTATQLEFVLAPRATDHSFLRFDPIAISGLFRINSLVLLDKNRGELFALSSPEDCYNGSELVNLELLSESNVCVALNDDPHLIFDLSEIDNLASARFCIVEIELQYRSEYETALERLAAALTQANQGLESQIQTNNTLKAELEYVNVRLNDAVEHRADLNRMLNNLVVEHRDIVRQATILARGTKERQALRQTNIHLNDQLVDQIRHNREVDHYLMQRPTTRLKSFISRSIGGDQAPEQDQPLSEEAAAEVQSPDVKSSLEDQLKTPPLVSTDKPVEKQTSGAAEPELIGQNTEDYQLWIEQNSLTEDDLERIQSDIEAMPHKPVFSILVPVYNTNPDYLIPMIRSVQAQLYPHWQLVLVDDASPKKWLRNVLQEEAANEPRITLQLNEANQGIALTSNNALSLASGDYIALLDHDDEISIDALYENAMLINQQPAVGLIYSDEDKMDLFGNRLEPYFKPDYSPDLLDTNNYVCHFTVIKRGIVEHIGGFQSGMDGSQDHDLILRACAASEKVAHIPKILYHWRKIPGSTAVEYDSKSYAWEAGRQAVENCVQTHSQGARVVYGSLKGTYRVVREITDSPLVSIIIPFKDKPELLDSCIGSILDNPEYTNFEIVGVNNNSEDPATFARMEHHAKADDRVRFVDKNIDFNFSAICNYGVEQARGEYIVLLNNDVVIDGNEWLVHLLEHAQRPEIGAVGGKLLYPDGRIQHAGIVVGMVGAAGHPHKFFPDTHIGYHGRLHMVYNVSAVTGAMLMVNKDKYLQVGGLDEDNLAVAYNDVDFCLKLMQAGYNNLFTPHSRGIHAESVSRGYEDTEAKLARLKREQAHFLSTWAEFIAKGDPYYNPNLSLLNERFSLKFAAEREAESN